MLKQAFDYTVTLFVIIDPFVSLVILLSLLPQSSDSNIPRIAFKSSTAVLIGSVVSIILGSFILDFFGVNISAFKIMGGIVLLFLAIQMVQAKISDTRYAHKEAEEAKLKEDISVIPLAIPGTLGPGTITTLLIYRSHTDLRGMAALFIAVLINCVILYLILRNAKFLQRMMSRTMLNVFTRLMGLIVGSISMQFIVGGAKELWMK